MCLLLHIMLGYAANAVFVWLMLVFYQLSNGFLC